MGLVVIVIPIPTHPLSYLEKISLRQVHTVLKDYPKVFVAPKKYSFNYGDEYGNYATEYFDETYFGSTDAHNRLLLSSVFYKRFIQYEYMLIYHLDAFVFSDKLKKFCSMQYDYIAAPGIRKYNWNGESFLTLHGGFSLRKIKSFIRILEEKHSDMEKCTVSEDIFYSWCGYKTKNFSIAPLDVAMKFSFETYARKLYSMNMCKLPFGCHAWWKRDFEFYRKFVEQCGYIINKNDIGYIRGDMDKKNRIENIYRYLFFRALRVKRKRVDIQKMLEGMFGIDAIYAIFGAGNDGCRFYEQMNDLIKIECFFDNAPNKWEKKICGLQIKKIDLNLLRKKSIIIIICTTYFREDIILQLERIGLCEGRDFIDFNKLQRIVIKNILVK